MLKVEKLNKRFGSFDAVKGISFSVSKGEVLGFLGPNGAGKSTTMRMITGFLPPTSGTAYVCGHDIVTNPVEAKKCIGYLPESALSQSGHHRTAAQPSQRQSRTQRSGSPADKARPRMRGDDRYSAGGSYNHRRQKVRQLCL